LIPLVLASTSPIRAQLLAAAGLTFATIPPGVDEDALKAELSAADPRALAQALADRKALAVSRQTPALVIGADQTLELPAETRPTLLDKVATLAEARARLVALRGRAHRLHAAVAVAQDGAILWRATETATLTMRAFSDAFLDGYLARLGEAVLSSSGCYHLEGEGAQLFSAVEGDYFAILGLPLIGVLAFLREQGAIAA
jgi:septum formation protein